MFCGDPFGVLSWSVLSSRVSKGIWFEDLDQEIRKPVLKDGEHHCLEVLPQGSHFQLLTTT